MPRVHPIDYKRASAVGRRIIEVDVPRELVARKGKSKIAKRRCQAAQEGLRTSIARLFEASRRRPYRGEVAIHLEIAAIDNLAAPKAHRTVKALIDAMKGAAFADDRAVALLDVRAVPGDRAAQISICSAGEYADRYDVLRGARVDEDDDYDDDYGWDDDHGWSYRRRSDPWAWDRELLEGDELEQAREALNDIRSRPSRGTDPDSIETFYERRVAELEALTFTVAPYQATDRPGKPNLAARIWGEADIRGGPNTLMIPAPLGGKGSWTAIAEEAWRDYAGSWPRLSSLLRRDSFALDIAIESRPDQGFDVDNLASRVLMGMRNAVPDAAAPGSYRVYRRAFTKGGKIAIALHRPERAEALRQVMTDGHLRLRGFRIDPDARIHRHRPDDDAALAEYNTALDDFKAA